MENETNKDQQIDRLLFLWWNILQWFHTEQKSSMIQEDKKCYIRFIWSELSCFWVPYEHVLATFNETEITFDSHDIDIMNDTL